MTTSAYCQRCVDQARAVLLPARHLLVLAALKGNRPITAARVLAEMDEAGRLKLLASCPRPLPSEMSQYQADQYWRAALEVVIAVEGRAALAEASSPDMMQRCAREIARANGMGGEAA